MGYDIVIEGVVFTGEELKHMAIGIDDGKIKDIKKTITTNGDKKDYGDRLILPGAIDIHVHFRDPGQRHKEDFYTGTMAAAYGGVTTIVDMPNNSEPVVDPGSYMDKMSSVEKKANVDFGLWFALHSKKRGDIEFAVEHSPGFKLYTAPTTGNLYRGEEHMKESIEAFISHITEIEKKTRVTVHCEDGPLIESRLDGRKELIKDLRDHSMVRDTGSEAHRIATILDMLYPLIHKNLIELNIAHVTSPGGVNVIRSRKKDYGGGLWCEVTPHHIYLNTTYRHPLYNNPAFGKVNPPLRDLEDQKKLWEAIANGDIDILATDHAPHTIDEKDQEFYKAPAGLPGVETSIPLMLYLLKKQNLSLSRFLELTAWNPAAFMGLESKGRIQVGYDADLMVVDFREERRIKGEELHSKCGWTPFEGYTAIFPMDVYLRGERVIHNWEIDVERNGVPLWR